MPHFLKQSGNDLNLFKRGMAAQKSGRRVYQSNDKADRRETMRNTVRGWERPGRPYITSDYAHSVYLGVLNAGSD